MKKILVVEDDKFLASAYRVKLSKSDFEVNIASNGQEALDVIDEFKPDAIILDLVMPVMDGFTTLKKIKENSSWNKIPVLIASNLGQKEDIDKAKNLGSADYIVKSNMSMDELVKKINTIIK